MFNPAEACANSLVKPVGPRTADPKFWAKIVEPPATPNRHHKFEKETHYPFRDGPRFSAVNCKTLSLSHAKKRRLAELGSI
jgi:hypothetical protein